MVTLHTFSMLAQFQFHAEEEDYIADGSGESDANEPPNLPSRFDMIALSLCIPRKKTVILYSVNFIL